MAPARTIKTTRPKLVKAQTTASDKSHLAVVLVCAASGDMLPPIGQSRN